LDLIADIGTMEELGRTLGGESRIAIDLEAAGFHRYSDRVCLIQLSTERDTWLVDPLSFDPAPVLRGPLEDRSVEVLVHGADYDIRLLDRDFGISPTHMFDTQIAATLIGEPSIGLAAMLEKYVDVKLAKKYQRADWAKRPLSDEMKDYAAADTRHLFHLSEILGGKVEELDRTEWLREECRAMEDLSWSEEEEEDPVTRFGKKARELDDREVHRLREVWMWRDAIARRRDRAPFRVCGDPVLLEIARQRPRSIGDMKDIQGMSGRLADRDGGDLLRVLDDVDAVPDDELEGYPPPDYDGPGRPTREEEARKDRLRKVRNTVSEELGIQKGVILSNAVLLEIARAQPRTRDELAAMADVRRWHVEVLGDRLLEQMDP